MDDETPSDDVPADVKEGFEEAVAFVVVLDFFEQEVPGEQPSVTEVKREREKVMNRLMEAYPSLEPTTEGFNPVTIVLKELGEAGILESHEGFAERLYFMEDWFEQRDEPVELNPTIREVEELDDN